MKKGMVAVGAFLLLSLGIGVAWEVDRNRAANSRHRLGATRLYVSTDATAEICVFCHTPPFSTSEAPRWTRAVPITVRVKETVKIEDLLPPGGQRGPDG